MIEDFNYKKLLAKSLERGGDFGELFVEEKRQIEVMIEDGKLERAFFGVIQGAGLRVLCDGRTRYACTNSWHYPELMELADKLKNTVDNLNETVVLPENFRRNEVQKISDILKAPDEVQLEEKVKMAFSAERTARAYDPRICQVKVRYVDSLRKIGIANSDGVLANDEQVQLLFFIEVVACHNGEFQMAYEAIGGTQGFELFDKDTPEEVALQCAKRAILMLMARRAPGGKMPVVLCGEAGGTMIHEAVGHGLEADLACEGLSVYKDMLGKEVANKLITVVDDKTIAGKRGSYRIDDEGTPSQRTVLIDKGVLVNYLYDLCSARKQKMSSTANGRRESYQFFPICRMSNTMILPGESSPDEIIKATSKGLFVKKMGGGQVNTVNGDFVFKANEAYLIEGGEVGEPVRGATLVGNGPLVLKEIDLVGNDLGFMIGTCGKDGQNVPVSDAQPTLRIPELVVGGEISYG